MHNAASWLGRSLICAMLRFVFGASPPGRAYYLNLYPKALCLDGSPGLYYFRPGHGDGATKFVIYHQGGGFCVSHEDCAERAMGKYGGTSRDEGTRNFDDVAFFSTAKSENPLMWNWNHIFVRYCDGAYFSGDRHRVVRVGTSSLHYKGRWITEALLDDLYLQWDLSSATDVVFSGCSAGAIRVFAHIDALRGRLPDATRVTGFPDSGFYLDVPMFTSLKRFVVTEQKASGLLNAACVKDHVGAEQKCLIASVAFQYIDTPMFVWQSRYDTDQRVCEMSPTCANSESCVREYGANLTSALRMNVRAAPKSAAFLDSCSRHCQGPTLPLDDATGQTPFQAFAAWYSGVGGQLYGQEASYPCHECCAPSDEQTNLVYELAKIDILYA